MGVPTTVSLRVRFQREHWPDLTTSQAYLPHNYPSKRRVDHGALDDETTGDVVHDRRQLVVVSVGRIHVGHVGQPKRADGTGDALAGRVDLEAELRGEGHCGDAAVLVELLTEDADVVSADDGVSHSIEFLSKGVESDITQPKVALQGSYDTNVSFFALHRAQNKFAVIAVVVDPVLDRRTISHPIVRLRA